MHNDGKGQKMGAKGVIYDKLRQGEKGELHNLSPYIVMRSVQ